MNTLENTVSSPIIDYGYPLLAFMIGSFLLWLTFTKAGRSSISGLVDVVYLSALLIVLWAAFLLAVAWFFGMLKFLIS